MNRLDVTRELRCYRPPAVVLIALYVFLCLNTPLVAETPTKPSGSNTKKSQMHKLEVGDEIFQVFKGTWNLDRVEVLIIAQVEAITAKKIKITVIDITQRFVALPIPGKEQKFDKYEVDRQLWVEPDGWKSTPVTGW